MNECTITIKQAIHQMTGNIVICHSYVLVSGSYVRGLWASEETYATIERNGDIVLHFPNNQGYSGAAVLSVESALTS